MCLSLSAVASAASINLESAAETGSVTVIFTPADSTSVRLVKGPSYATQDQTLPLGLGSTYYMSGENWLILYGTNVVSLSGNKATMIGYGTAQVQAFKSNGAVLGVYTFIVKR